MEEPFARVEVPNARMETAFHRIVAPFPRIAFPNARMAQATSEVWNPYARIVRSFPRAARRSVEMGREFRRGDEVASRGGRCNRTPRAGHRGRERFAIPMSGL